MDVLNGRFSIIEEIAENRLYRAIDTATGSHVAIKKWVNEDGFFEAELKALTLLKHLNVPQIVCSFQENGANYIAEQWLDGREIQQANTSQDIVSLAIQIAEFLSAISSSSGPCYIHGDIKPSNIIIKDGRAYFIDFECSKQIGEEKGQETGETLRITGRYFTAPETFYGKQRIQSDIYSLGAVMAWMLGGIDNEGINLSKINTNSKLKNIINKCIKYKAEDRYKDAMEVINDLLIINHDTTDIVLKEDIRRGNFSVFVDCNVFFAWEIAMAAATYFGMKACVIAVTERTQKKLSYFADINKNYGAINVEDDKAMCFFSAESLLKRDAETWKSKGFINNSALAEGRLYFSENRFSREAEPENEEYIKDLVAWGKNNFNLVVFVTDRYDDKPAVKNFTFECDYTIATPLANIDDVEACKDYYERFGGNVLYAAWEFNKECSLPEESIKIIVGEEKYLGAISRDDNKNYRRNFAGKIQPIFMSEGKEEHAGYVKMINRLFRL